MLFHCGFKGAVNAVDNPAEETGIDVFGQSVSTIDGIYFGDRFNVGFGSRLYFLVT